MIKLCTLLGATPIPLLAATAAVAALVGGSLPSGAQAPPKKLPLEIVGGTPAPIANHPWQVSIMMRSGEREFHFCGGSLIRPDWVLTAAHCLAMPEVLQRHNGPVPAEMLRIRAGASTVGGTEGEIIEVDSIHIHEGWQQFPTGNLADIVRTPDRPGPSTLANDIALLKLKRPSTAGRVIALASDTLTIGAGDEVEITGWGAISEGGPGSRQLLRAAPRFIAFEACNSAARYDGNLTDGMICAGTDQGGVDTCQGDSGGPMVRRTPAGPVLIGVTSFGIGCARANRPGVYSSVLYFRTWITTTIAFR